ncbi:MAG TPA: AI-2E family transporter, partial [Patescibacteria group bacterium]|nr:AI-2E family transporter [Patescibacteria group bacterium]
MSVPGQPASDRPSLAPVWLDHLAALGWRVLVTVALAAVVVWLALILDTITVSVLVAVIIAATFAPLATALRNRGWSRTKTAAVVTVGAILVITAVIVLIVLAFVPYVPDIIAGIQAGLTKAQANLAASGVSTTELSGVEAQAQAWLSDHISAIVGAVGTAVTIAILGGILLFFLLQDGDKAWVWCLQAMGDWQRERITSSGDDALQRVGGYLRGTALLAGAHAATDLVFLILLGVPLPAPLAVLVFFGGFIPYVGGLVTSLVVLGVAYAAIGAQGTFILLVLIVITNVILNNIVRPVVYGKTVHIHPAVVLIALPAGAAVAGVVGLFVAIPVVAFVTAVWGSVVAILEPEQDSVAEIGIVPGWLDRVAQWSWRLLIGAALLGFAVWLAVMLPLVVMPIVLAVVLAATFAPMAGALLRRGWGRGRAALTVTAGAFLIITGIMVLTSVVLVEQLQPLVAQAAAGATKIDTATNGALSSLTSTTGEATGAVVDAARSFSSGIAGLVIVLVLA